MVINYTITPELRVKLKDPFGTLIRGTFYETMNEIKNLVEAEKPLLIISVGDVVSRNLHESNLNPQLTIIDNVSLRNLKMHKELPVKRTVYVKNPQGTITYEAIHAVKEALEKKGHTHIIVDGEEDLAVIPLVIAAPDGAIVLYGQPHQGVVLRRVDQEAKETALHFLTHFIHSEA